MLHYWYWIPEKLSKCVRKYQISVGNATNVKVLLTTFGGHYEGQKFWGSDTWLDIENIKNVGKSKTRSCISKFKENIELCLIYDNIGETFICIQVERYTNANKWRDNCETNNGTGRDGKIDYFDER